MNGSSSPARTASDPLALGLGGDVLIVHDVALLFGSSRARIDHGSRDLRHRQPEHSCHLQRHVLVDDSFAAQRDERLQDRDVSLRERSLAVRHVDESEGTPQTRGPRRLQRRPWPPTRRRSACPSRAARRRRSRAAHRCRQALPRRSPTPTYPGPPARHGRCAVSSGGTWPRCERTELRAHRTTMCVRRPMADPFRPRGAGCLRSLDRDPRAAHEINRFR